MKQSILTSIKQFFATFVIEIALLCEFYKFKITHKCLRIYNGTDNNNNYINNSTDARPTGNNNKIANVFHLAEAWKYLQQCFSLQTVYSVRNMYWKLYSIGIGGSSGGGGGCHSTFHTTQWIFHELFFQTEYNSVSFWGKLYLIELNVGLECIVKYCAFCISMCMFLPNVTCIRLFLSPWQQFTFFIESSDTFIAYFVCLWFDLIYSNEHSLNFIVDINNDGCTRNFKIHTHTLAHITAFPYRILKKYLYGNRWISNATHVNIILNSEGSQSFVCVLLNPFCSVHFIDY